MTYPLHLTTPYTRGHDVELAQRALNNAGKLGDFYDGAIDGVYGEHTANSTRKAKDHIGYPLKQVNRIFDGDLLDYLTGKKKLKPAMQVRRAARYKKRQQQQDGHVFPAAIKLGMKEVGTKESPPNSNRVKYSVWYGVIGSWCAMFQTWIFVNSNSKVFQRGHRWAYVPSILADAHNGYGDLRVVGADHARHCKTDLALWNFPGEDHHPNHVSAVLDINGQIVKSLDGNTSVSNQSNGGEVMVRTRDISLVEAFVHVSE